MSTQDDGGDDADEAVATGRAQRAAHRGFRRSGLVLLICLALVGGLAVAISWSLIRRSERSVAAESAVEVIYCAGWDPQTRKPVGLMNADEARTRDSAGDPYAVLLTTNTRPKALLQVDWGRDYLGLFLFEQHGRRDRAYDFRELEPGLLHLIRYEQWRYASPDTPEFPERGWHFTLTARPDSDIASVELDQGSLLQTAHDIPARYRSLRRAPFGDWMAYAHGRMLGLEPGAGGIGGVTVVPSHQEPATPLWRAPSGMQPRHLQALFTPGSRFSDTDLDTAVVTEPATAGALQVPTGAVIAADPGTLDSDEPFTVTVPPGDYPVLIAGMRWAGKGWGETTAAMLRISDKPTASWELAVRPGQDVRLLGDDEFYGFGVDTGTGAFLDASGRDSLAAAYEQQQQSGATDGDTAKETADPKTGTNLIAYPSGRGDGSYPVWIGRAADGAITCLVADMLLLRDMKPMQPATPDTAVFLTPTPTHSARPEPKPAGPEATAEFLATVIADVVATKKRIG
ncbi:DUF4241 domain-containing protein [Dactylosporangium sp. AC04546]|uniref:DUF4241 domain-containing protein n=1 Tax=Dactylosporangium sp. AC04546 TaxID=2862460 RepID=UPI001EDD86A7|nr:DUF4241 domain-containing protein [Dactylosporangium sp. AC04546]WVK86361.1 DUF4241 domain-containing protein [Dactylosporangium sp. AC04546]